MTARPPRKRVHAIAQGRGANERLVVPLAFEIAARISARPLDQFLTDPTQLANGLLELHRAIGADGIVCAAASGMEFASARGGPADVDRLTQPGTRVGASLEATRRLRATVGDAAALVAGITGPATLARQFGVDFHSAAAVYTAMVKHYCDAGTDLVIVFEEHDPADAEPWHDTLRTGANVVRFHRGVTLLWDRDGALPRPRMVALTTPEPVQTGIVMTAERVAEDASIETLRRWVQIVAGG